MKLSDLVLRSGRGLWAGLCLVAVTVAVPGAVPVQAHGAEGAALAGAATAAGPVVRTPQGECDESPALRRSGGFAHSPAAVPEAVKEQVDSDLDGYLRSSRSVSARSGVEEETPEPLPATITVPVRVHVIRGSKRSDPRVTRNQARQVVATLREGFSGSQDTGMVPTGIRFELRSVDITRNNRWFRAAPGSRADRQMHRALHRGTRETLNIYLNALASPDGDLLGIARFPWRADAQPKLDGVTINLATLPGGRARGYNLGDTVIHEVGHWFGLLHTFEGGCGEPGDYVSDTAPEARPNYVCELDRDTCPSERPREWLEGDPEPEPVADPVQNFMDYSLDRCMNHFTPGQRERAVAAFMRYRFGR